MKVSSSYELESGKISAAKAYHIFQENIRMIYSKKLQFFGTFGLNLESKWEPDPLKMLKKKFLCGSFQNFRKETRQITESKAPHIFLEDILVIHIEKILSGKWVKFSESLFKTS